ncbi:MAG: CoB--CoM heterodisulfide reductase iron-sulfur subunit A family protein [Acidobacteria bacterium]|nr:CoB--CoM heterodisulfide reductase iron-sulfur subunit A family protein [Acidobacteriota bacterium]
MTDLEDTQPKPENKKDEPRVGVYVCHCGGNISDVVDVEKVVAEAAQLPGVAVSRTNMFMCSDPGQKMIQEDIQKGLVDNFVVAACTRSLHETTFASLLARNGVNPYLLEQANIREQCSWPHHGQEAATAKAFTLVRAAVAKARRLVPLNPVRVEATNCALVIGGGVAGLRAAGDLSKLGIKVVLVEREKELGGFVRRLDALYPDEEPATALLSRLVEAVRTDSGIVVHTNSEVTGIEGYIGNFTAQVRKNSDSKAGEIRIEAGTIIVATGFRSYQPAKKELGYQKLSRVVTLADFNELLVASAGDSAVLEFEGKPVRSVGFVHCVGSRQIEGVHKPGENGNINRYCSRVCCTATLHTACRLRRRFPDMEIHDFYQDIRTYGRGHEDYYEQASKSDVIFHRYRAESPPRVAKAPAADEYNLLITVEDSLTAGEEIEVGVDILVLAVGMMPADNATIIDNLKLASSSDGFLQEVHPKLRPVEMAVNGVLLAGACQAPKDITESCASASAAAIKAAAILRKGYVELDPYVVKVDLARCEGTGLCVEECPLDGALHMVGEGNERHVEVNPAICNGCGCCVAVCPTRALQVSGWTLDQYEAMVDAIVADPVEVSS